MLQMLSHTAAVHAGCAPPLICAAEAASPSPAVPPTVEGSPRQAALKTRSLQLHTQLQTMSPSWLLTTQHMAHRNCMQPYIHVVWYRVVAARRAQRSARPSALRSIFCMTSLLLLHLCAGR